MLYIYRRYRDCYDYREMVRLEKEDKDLERLRPRKIIATVPYSNNRGVRQSNKILSDDNIGIKNYYRKKGK